MQAVTSECERRVYVHCKSAEGLANQYAKAKTL